MVTGAFNVGGVAHLATTFTVGGVATDPTTVTLYVEDPSGVTSTFATDALTHDGDGAYSYNLTVTKAGQWRWRWVGTGAAAGAEQGSFLARAKVPA